MKKTLLLAAAALMLPTAMHPQSWPKAAPEAKAGSRWYIHGSAVTEKDLSWNLAEYARTGIGFLELTPIYGVQGNEQNNIPFLSAEWMEKYKFIVQEAARNNIQVDMATGTGWLFGGPTTPISEAACKLVYTDQTVSGQQCRALNVGVTDEEEAKYATLSRVMAYAPDGRVTDVTAHVHGGVLRWNKARRNASYRIIALYDSRTRQQVKRAAPGGEGWVVDHFSREAVEHYLQHLDSAFAATGAPYPRCFFNDSYEVYHADWTPTLLSEFQRRRGYKLEEHLPEFLEGDDTQVLSDYRETLGELLYENMTQPWAEWARRHGAKTRNQAHGSPGNLIDIYAATDIPEIEGFGYTDFGIKGLRNDSGFTRPNFSDVSMLKYASSASHITGKPLTSCETFTWLTEHFRTSLSQMKPDLDLIFTCGVNHMFFMSTTYSPKDDPWPGWQFYATVNMSPVNSIWRDAPYLMKYIERTQSFLQMGQPDNDFLVYLPVRDMWAIRKSDDGPFLMLFDIHHMAEKAPAFIKSILQIDKEGFDCDYISDHYLLSTRCQDGMLVTEAGTRYKALLLTNQKPMPDEVKAHVEKLRKQGANIVYGTNADELKQLAKPEAMKTRLGLRAIRRKNDTGHHYFIANLTGTDISEPVELAVPFKDAALFNPLDGSISKATVNDGKVLISLRSGESVILQTYDHALTNLKEKTMKPTGTVKPLDGKWTLAFVESAPKVERTFALDRLTTWEGLDDDSVKITMGTGAYATQLSLTEQEAASRWMIDLGDVRESARVYINDHLIGCAWSAPFVLECGKTLRAGNNSIRIEVTNLPANRIADLDRRGVQWRKFTDINMVSLNYKNATYGDWKPVPSGLNSTVRLIQLED